MCEVRSSYITKGSKFPIVQRVTVVGFGKISLCPLRLLQYFIGRTYLKYSVTVGTVLDFDKMFCKCKEFLLLVLKSSKEDPLNDSSPVLERYYSSQTGGLHRVRL